MYPILGQKTWPPEFTAPPTAPQQSGLSPFALLLALQATGKLPKGFDSLLSNPGQKYYFARRQGGIRLMRHLTTDYEKTPARLIQQARIRDAVAAWKLLSPEEKYSYQKNRRAQARRLPGYHYFVSLYCKGQIPI